MGKLMCRIAALVVLQGGGMFAQSLTGTWQGPMLVPQAPGGQLRVVFKIATTDADTLKGDMLPARVRAGSGTGPQHPAPFPQSADRWTV
jgi:hypothetical protein